MNLPLLVIQIVNLLLLAFWLFLTISALIALQRRSFNTTQHLTWAALIILVPFLGAAAFWILHPNQS